MGERIINPIHNIFKQYKKVNLVNPYLFAKPFVSTWRTSSTSTGSSTSTQVKLPLIISGTYNFVVDWGDGSSSVITAWNQAQVTHTYSIAGDYTIKITGNCTGWAFNNTGDRLKIRSITTWGKFNSGGAAGAFYGCSNLNLTGVTDIPNLVGIGGSLNSFFRGCTSLTTIGRLNEWDVSSISNFALIFGGCTNFNQNIGAWNVSNASTFGNAFNLATSFNNGGSPDIGNWVFRTTGSLTLASMFVNATSFNKDISAWNTNRVNSTVQMFQGAVNFNNGLASGVVGNMLWDLSNVTTTNSMFLFANKFNQNLGVLNLANCTDISYMFQDATLFNNGGSSDIGNWILKTTGTLNMRSTFENTTAFNQNIGNWDVRAVNNFVNFMRLKTFSNYSSANLDAIYNGWSTRPVVASMVITFGTIKYTVASSAGRAILTGAPNLWSITDGGI